MCSFVFFDYLFFFFCFLMVFFAIFVTARTTKYESNTNIKECQDSVFDIQAHYPTEDDQQEKEGNNTNNDKRCLKPFYFNKSFSDSCKPWPYRNYCDKNEKKDHIGNYKA